jgi:hypothetical protein
VPALQREVAHRQFEQLQDGVDDLDRGHRQTADRDSPGEVEPGRGELAQQMSRSDGRIAEQNRAE